MNKLFYFYSTISFIIIMIFYIFNIYNLNQLFLSLNYSKLIKLFFIMNYLSPPPFLGFLPKWLVIMNLVNNNVYTFSMVLIILTLITLFFYIRIYLSTLTITMKETILKTNLNIFFLIFINMITLLGLFLCTSIFNIL